MHLDETWNAKQRSNILVYYFHETKQSTSASFSNTCRDKIIAELQQNANLHHVITVTKSGFITSKVFTQNQCKILEAHKSTNSSVPLRMEYFSDFFFATNLFEISDNRGSTFRQLTAEEKDLYLEGLWNASRARCCIDTFAGATSDRKEFEMRELQQRHELAVTDPVGMYLGVQVGDLVQVRKGTSLPYERYVVETRK
jgi:hypothetical protein